MGLGPTPNCLVAGDWNHDPVSSPLRLFPQCSVRSPSFAPDPDDPDAGLSPTRWDGQDCIDWEVCRKVTCDVELLLDRWADHRVLAWNLHNVRMSAVKQLRLTCRTLQTRHSVRRNVASPGHWQLFDRRHLLPEAPSWEQLFRFTNTKEPSPLEKVPLDWPAVEVVVVVVVVVQCSAVQRSAAQRSAGQGSVVCSVVWCGEVGCSVVEL